MSKATAAPAPKTKRVSLWPLTPEEALKVALGTSVTEKATRRKKKRQAPTER
jgi:hypothetical protein